jgi:hypothetical protein
MAANRSCQEHVRASAVTSLATKVGAMNTRAREGLGWIAVALVAWLVSMALTGDGRQVAGMVAFLVGAYGLIKVAVGLLWQRDS